MQLDTRSKLIGLVLFPVAFIALVMFMATSASPVAQAEGGAPLSRSVSPSAPQNVYLVTSSSNAAITSCAGAANDCSLRGAVQLANASAGSDTINISAAVTAISLSSPITLTGDSITIHGNGQEVTSLGTAGNFPALVINSNSDEIDGLWIKANSSRAGTGQHGIVINGSNNTLQHNSLSDLGGDGVLLQGSANGNTVQYNVIGVQTVGGITYGSCVFPNDQWGVQINNVGNNGIYNNTIGCSGEDGVVISGTTATANIVFNNYIGVTNWAVRVPNTLSGVAMLSGAHENFIGLQGSGGNVIGANGSFGVFIGTSYTNTVALNSIGISGTTNISNTLFGVTLQSGAAGNIVISNTIANNGTTGIYLTGSTNNRLEANLVHNQGGYGVLAQTNANGNIIDSNIVGVQTSGSIQLAGCAFSNAQGGIRLSGSTTNKVYNNVVGCNGVDGISIAGPTANGNEVYGNYVGITNLGGRVPNTLAGIAVLSGAHDNLIGLSTQGNIIGANKTYGVYIGTSGTNMNTLQMNSIGISGTLNISNTLDGVTIQAGAQSNRIVTNTIADNSGAGVSISGAGTNSNVLSGNTIRLNQWGVQITSGAAFNSIGVYGNRAAGNVLSANSWSGLAIWDATTCCNAVYGNMIGTNAAGNAADGNLNAEILLDSETYSNTIGGLATERNVIGGGISASGVVIANGAHDNVVRGNDIGLNRDFSPTADAAAFGPASVSGPASPAGGGGPYLVLSNLEGIDMDGAYSNTIGGYITGSDASNYIFYNRGSGIRLFDGSQYNVIGLNAISANAFDGVSLYDPTTANNTITRTQISHNARDGIWEDSGLLGNVWSEVGISASGGPGIDVNGDGVTAPYVFIDSINRTTGVVSGHGHATDGVLNITKVELYRVSPNPSGFGEGQTFIGRATTDASGNWTITDTSPSVVRGCYTAFITESHPFLLIPPYSSEFSANTCRVFLPLALKN